MEERQKMTETGEKLGNKSESTDKEEENTVVFDL
jgi:hypothetical protein